MTEKKERKIHSQRINIGIADIFVNLSEDFQDLPDLQRGYFMGSMGNKILALMHAIEGEFPSEEAKFVTFIYGTLVSDVDLECEEAKELLLRCKKMAIVCGKRLEKYSGVQEAINASYLALIASGISTIDDRENKKIIGLIEGAMSSYILAVGMFHKELLESEVQSIANHISLLSGATRSNEETKNVYKRHMEKSKQTHEASEVTH